MIDANFVGLFHYIMLCFLHLLGMETLDKTASLEGFSGGLIISVYCFKLWIGFRFGFKKTAQS